MAKQKLNDQKFEAREQRQEERQGKVIEQVSKTEQFFNEHGKAIWMCLLGILILALLILAYVKFYYQPKRAEAMQQTYPAEASFRSGNYDVALNGDGNALGFAQIIKDYGKKAGKAVYLYAGICELNLGNYDQAITYLKKYKGKDDILAARALACIGDAYVGLEDYNSALSWYDKAAAQVDNAFVATYLLKAGVVCEELGDNAKALTYYKKIKDQYPQSVEGYDIDKYITRLESQQK